MDGASTSKFLIYGLFDPRSGELRYVGKTEGRLSKRLNEHVCRAWRQVHQSHVYAWIRSLGEGVRPEIDVLETAANHAELVAAERWNIEYWRSLGCDLTNHTAGGEGCQGYRHSAEARQRISTAKRNRPRTEAQKRVSEKLRKCTPAQEQEIAVRYQAGESMATLAVPFGVSSGCVRKILIRAGVPRRVPSVSRWMTERAA